MYPLLRIACDWMLVGRAAGGMSVRSSLSHPLVASSWDLLHLKNLYHFLTFSGLAFVLIRALCLSGVSDFAIVLASSAALLATAYGAWGNSPITIPDRPMGVNDLLADGMEVSMVTGVWSRAQRGRPVLIKS